MAQAESKARAGAKKASRNRGHAPKICGIAYKNSLNRFIISFPTAEVPN
jgi:hypothetical protein